MPKIVDADQRRAEILAALWRVVDRDGASAVSVRSIAREGGWSKSNIGHYFPTQGALLALAMEQAVATVTERILALDLLQCDVDTAIKALATIVPDTPQRRRQASIWLAALNQSASDESVHNAVHDLNTTVRDGIGVILRALQNQRLLASEVDVDEASRLLHTVIDGLSLHVLTDSAMTKRPAVRRTIALALEPMLQESASQVSSSR